MFCQVDVKKATPKDKMAASGAGGRGGRSGGPGGKGKNQSSTFIVTAVCM